ncbi:Uncharacterised protein [Mycobacteroides abscessus subsp. abscessus]|nr:Uncharacterised protein [Mycobacteroides abscessus subsp. abscessus]
MIACEPVTTAAAPLGTHSRAARQLLAQTNTTVSPCLYFDAVFQIACATAATKTMATTPGGISECLAGRYPRARLGGGDLDLG